MATKTVKTEKGTWLINTNIDNVIGKGGFGIIYKARNAEGKTIAAKSINARILPQMLSKDLEKFLQLKHPSIINTYDAFQQGEHLWLFMEYCPYGDLNQFFETIDLPFPEMTLAMAQLAQGTEYLHNSNVIHRDIKPANILVSQATPLSLKLTDFDLSKFMDAEVESSVMSTNVGTLAFKAPEFFQRTDKNKISYHRNVDIFSAGLTYLAMLQAKKGTKMLVPRCESPRDPSELIVAIGIVIVTRIRLGLSGIDLSVVAVDESAAETGTVKLKKLIQGMTSAKPEDRPSATDVFKTLTEVSAEFTLLSFCHCDYFDNATLFSIATKRQTF